MLKKLMLVLLLFPVLAFSESEGTKLVNKFWKNAIAKRIDKIASTMSPHFQGLYMSPYCSEVGGVITKQQELQFLRGSTATSYVLSNIRTTKNKRILVVTYDVQLSVPVTPLGHQPLVPLTPVSVLYHEIFTYYRSGSHWELASLAFYPQSPLG